MLDNGSFVIVRGSRAVSLRNPIMATFFQFSRRGGPVLSPLWIRTFKGGGGGEQYHWVSRPPDKSPNEFLLFIFLKPKHMLWIV